MNSSSYSHDQGVVVKKNISNYHVRIHDHVEVCGMAMRLRKELSYSAENPNASKRVVRDVKGFDKTDPIVVGDRVIVANSADGMRAIIEILPRLNQLSRQDPAPGTHKFEQVIVANVDFILPVFAVADPTPKWGLLDRYLVSAESMQIPVIIVITKVDLINDRYRELELVLEMYQRIGYPVILTSSLKGTGMEELRHILSGRLSAFVGKSGVGKTALLNALELGLGLRMGRVGNGKIGKGRHTTSAAEMVPLSFGGDIIDTPGVREFALNNLDRKEIAKFFPEMRPFIGACKFRSDCRHDEEPGCAIRRAVMEGKIDPHRYQSYLTLIKEI
jgi:ribosome biogenesis GTPase / thiamine phosphate phosphatase